MFQTCSRPPKLLIKCAETNIQKGCKSSRESKPAVGHVLARYGVRMEERQVKVVLELALVTRSQYDTTCQQGCVSVQQCHSSRSCRATKDI